MRRRPRVQRSKDTWYVSFDLPGQPRRPRTTETFRNELDAKEFAKAKLTEGSNVAAGTLNPHLPKRTISSQQMLERLDKPDQ
jgi:hypothetical protein